MIQSEPTGDTLAVADADSDGTHQSAHAQAATGGTVAADPVVATADPAAVPAPAPAPVTDPAAQPVA